MLLTFQMALPMMVPLSGGTVSSPSISATRQWSVAETSLEACSNSIGLGRDSGRIMNYGHSL